MPNWQEQAELIVGSLNFQDWETVYVQHRWKQGWPTFRFTSTEKDLPTEWSKLQFKPGDRCKIMLGRQLGVTGIITNRQVTYTATEHGIQLSGVGEQWAPVTSSVPMEDKKNTFDKMTTEAAFMKAVSQVGGIPKIIGKVNNEVFDSLQAQPGEMTWDLLNRLAVMRQANLGSDHEGAVLLIGKHTAPVLQELIEGENILKMQCVFSMENMYQEFKLTGQYKVTDEQTMRKAAEVRAKALSRSMPDVLRKLEIPAENQDKNLQARATYEAMQADATQCTANVTVQGWLRDGVNLWRCGDCVVVRSPMCPLDLVMKIKTATFAQDSRAGTTTLLECVLPFMFDQQDYAGGNDPGTPQAPDQAKDISDQIPKLPPESALAPVTGLSPELGGPKRA